MCIEKCVLVCNSASIGKISLVCYTLCFTRMRYQHCTFGCNRLIMKGSLLEEQRAVWTVTRLLLEKFLWFVTPYALLACAINTVRLVVIG